MANSKGRPKGSQNKSSAPIRDRVGLFISENWKQVELDYQSLTAKDRLNFISKLLPYVVAQMQSVDIKKQTVDELSELSNEQLNKVINTILENE
jgi:uncharacterized protein YjiS (DUF1127 family)